MNPSVKRALLRGHLSVNLPVVAIIALGPVAAGATFGLIALVAGLLIAPAIAWIWWSYSVPKWRDWVVDHGLLSNELEEAAVRTGLLWPRGSFFERTEFRRRSGRRGW